MRAIVCLFAMVFALTCCKSKEKLMASDSGNLTTEPVEVVVKEEVKDTLTINLKPENPRPESVKLTRGDAMMRYCVIVGSFTYENNADKLRENLIGMGFAGSCIMRNQQGMYRVSAFCSDDLSEARSRQANIRNQYPQFSDAWLLQVKE